MSQLLKVFTDFRANGQLFVASEISFYTLIAYVIFIFFI